MQPPFVPIFIEYKLFVSMMGGFDALSLKFHDLILNAVLSVYRHLCQKNNENRFCACASTQRLSVSEELLHWMKSGSVMDDICSPLRREHDLSGDIWILGRAGLSR